MPKPPANLATLSPVIVLAGEELYLRTQQITDIQHQLFGNEDPGMGLVRLDAAALGAEAMAVILDEVRTPSMFAPKKLVIVDPADPLFKKADAGAEDDDPSRLAPREILEHYVAAPVEGSTLLLVFDSWLKTTRLHKMLDKAGAVRWCLPIKEAQVPSWIIQRAREGYQKNIDPAATDLLADLIGPDLQRLDNELAKLSLYEPQSPAITRKAVDALVGFQHEEEIWGMINALASKDARTALEKIDALWALEPKKMDYSANGAIFVWLSQVLKARELVDRRLSDAVIVKEAKLWPPERAQKVLTMARQWGLDGAARWSDAMLRMDIANKASLGEPRRNLEKFIVELCAA